MSRKLTAGASLAQYKIIDLIGEGGMGAVYEALDESLDRHVAIKTLLSEVAQDPESRKRFFREGKAAAKLRHPHVVEVYGVGIEDEIPYLVMELLNGESFAAMLDRETQIPTERVIDILLPVISALVIAHQEGVIHRDLKPDNIFLQKTRAKTMVPKLLDFGISKVTGAHNSRITHTSSLMGTPYYMSPEQARGGKDIDAQIDQWSMGVILYEALAGERPITGDTVLEILHRIATMPIKPLGVAVPHVSPELAGVVMRALDREPAKRWPSMSALGHALLPFASANTRATWNAAFDKGPSTERPPPPRAELPTDSAEVEVVRPPKRRANEAAETIAASPKNRPDSERPAAVDAMTIVPGSQAAPSPARDERTREIAPLAAPTTPKGPTSSGPVELPTNNRGPIVVGAGAVAIVGVALFLAFGANGTSAERTTSEHGATTRPAPPATAPPTPPATAPPVTAPPVTAPPVTAPPVATYEATLTITPPAATIELDGVSVGTGTWTATLPRDGREHHLRISAEGHQPVELAFTDAPPPSPITLERARRVLRPGGGPGSASGSTPPVTSGTAPDTTMASPQVGANGSFILQ